MTNHIPEFEMTGGEPESVYTNPKFHERILDLVENTLNGDDNTILCFIIDDSDNIITAELEPESHHTALSKSLEFFVGIEDYEMCSRIKNTLNKL